LLWLLTLPEREGRSRTNCLKPLALHPAVDRQSVPRRASEQCRWLLAALDSVLFEERRWGLARKVGNGFTRRQLDFELMHDRVNALRATAEDPASAEGHERLCLAH
jgi:hypothetical protein